MMLGYIGLGKMGKNMVLHLLEEGVGVVVWNRSEGPKDSIRGEVLSIKGEEVRLKVAESIADLVNYLETPRIIWLMLTAGEATDEILNQLTPLLTKGDLIIDGGNSFYKDTVRRSKDLDTKGIHFMDVGTSGGPNGARTGACLMVGGAKEDFEQTKDILKKIAAPGALAHLGKVGAGHFAKMVHNGVEYGMMEAIAEGAAVLKASYFEYDLAKVMELYNHKSVIESRLVGWAKEALAEDPSLDKVSSKINHSGEGEWTINTAKELEVEVPVIEDSFQARVKSSEESNSFKDKVVSVLRGKFGGHKVKKVD